VDAHRAIFLLASASDITKGGESAMRYIGVDLHKTNFVVCFLAVDETTRTETYPLTKLGIKRFIAHLEPNDEVAVEVTANIYYFYDRVRPMSRASS
jgi:hypothetical protein